MAKWERSPGVWQIKIYVGLDIEKRKQFEFFTFKGSFKEAEFEETRLKLLYSRRRRTSVNNYTISEVCDLYMSNYAELHLRETTQGDYALIIEKRIKPLIGNIKLAKLSPSDVQYYMRETSKLRLDNKKAPLSKGSKLKNYRILHAILEWCVQSKHTQFNAASAVKAPKPPKYIPAILNVDEAVLFLQSAKETFPRQEYLLTLLSIGLGSRKAELLSIKWQDINFEYNTIKLLKSYTRKSESDHMKTDSSYRTVEAPDFVLTELSADYSSIENKNTLVFDGFNYDGFLKHYFKPLLKKLGFSSDIRFHDSRHSHASFLLAAGVDMKQISHQLGHAKISTTFDIYAHLLKTDEVSSKLGSLLGDKLSKTPKKPVKNSKKPQKT